MNELEAFDTERIEAELERRKREKELRDKPQQLPNPDWSTVQAWCQEYIDDLYQHGYVHSDSDHYIFEAAMAAVFGNDVWKWINARMR